MEAPSYHPTSPDSSDRPAQSDTTLADLDAAATLATATIPTTNPNTSPEQHLAANTDGTHNAVATIDEPPFWTRHGRSVSSVSYHSLNQVRPLPISLEDHSEEDHAQTQACWARSVTVDEHVVVSGSTGVGAYVVWHCTVQTLKGGDLKLRKRYSEFDRLRADLVRAFPHAEAMIPLLPRKSVVSRFRPKFLEQRGQGLAHFLMQVVTAISSMMKANQLHSCILLNPEFAASPILKDFIFS